MYKLTEETTAPVKQMEEQREDVFSRMEDVDQDRGYLNRTGRKEGCMQSLPSSWKGLGTMGDMQTYSSETVAFLWASVNA